MNIQHSSRTDLWYTPLHIIDMVKQVLGTIDLDPASDPDANRRVGATRFFTDQEDGLLVDWSGASSVFLNPQVAKRATNRCLHCSGKS